MSSQIELDALAVARATLLQAARELERAAERLDESFGRAVDLLAGRKGKVVTTGVGKSGLVAKRLAATLTSTGTPAVSLHPTDAVHGDAGLFQPGDTAIFISKSGGSDELAAVLEITERFEIPVVAITGRGDSPLARAATVVLALGDIAETRPLEFVPTTSVTVFQTLGDALAMAVAARRGFRSEDFAFLHPGGVLGRAMRRTVGELMHQGERLPRAHEGDALRGVLVEILEKRLGIACVVADDGRLVGVITDGDVKRIVLSAPEGEEHLVWRRTAGEVMSRHPTTCSPDTTVARAVRLMEEHEGGAITALVVCDEDGAPQGVVHLHDCLRAGLASDPERG